MNRKINIVFGKKRYKATIVKVLEKFPNGNMFARVKIGRIIRTLALTKT